MSQTFSMDDVATRNRPDSLWVIIDQNVYDVTEFQKHHPGGKNILQKFAGRDASKQFKKFHTEAESILLKYKDDLQIGGVEIEAKAESTAVVDPIPETAQPVVAIA